MAAATGQVQITVNGVRSAVRVEGPQANETAVVFVHGSLSDSRDWVDLMAQVAEFARCAAPDMPGFGEADKPADFSYTADGYAKHLGGLIEAMGIKRVHLVTHDLGGVWGPAWAADHPDQLASLTLMSIGVLPDYRWHRFARVYRTPLLGELTLATATKNAVRWAMQSGGTHRIPDEAIGRALRSSRNAGTRRAVLRCYRGTSDPGAETVAIGNRLRAVDPPTLVIWGRGDPYVPVRYAQIQGSFFPGAKVVELDGVGHYPLLEDPAAVSSALVPFLRTQLGVG